MQLTSLISIAVLHRHGAPHVAIPPMAWLCVPARLCGTWWGLSFFQRMTDRQFRIAVNLLLIVSGAGLVL